MWSNTDKGQIERCDQIQIKFNKKGSNTDNGHPERCDQTQIKVN